MDLFICFESFSWNLFVSLFLFEKDMSRKCIKHQSSTTDQTIPGSSEQLSSAEESGDDEAEESTVHSGSTDALMNGVQHSSKVATRPRRANHSISASSTATSTASDPSETEYAFRIGDHAYHTGMNQPVIIMEDVLIDAPDTDQVEVKFETGERATVRRKFLQAPLPPTRSNRPLLRSALTNIPRMNYKEASDCDSNQLSESAASSVDAEAFTTRKTKNEVIDLTTPESSQMSAAATGSTATSDSKYPDSTVESSSQQLLEPWATVGTHSSVSFSADDCPRPQECPQNLVLCIDTQAGDGIGNFNASPLSTDASFQSPTSGDSPITTTPFFSPDNTDGRSDSSSQNNVMGNALMLGEKISQLEDEVSNMTAEVEMKDDENHVLRSLPAEIAHDLDEQNQDVTAIVQERDNGNQNCPTSVWVVGGILAAVAYVLLVLAAVGKGGGDEQQCISSGYEIAGDYEWSSDCYI
jgi:hypothetical protein